MGWMASSVKIYSIIFPSNIFTIRFAFAPTDASCVMSMIVLHSSLRDLNISSTSAPVFESSAPVGSSASSTEGDHAIARAIAILCCCPPDSSLGLLESLWLNPTLSRAFIASLSHIVWLYHWYSSGSITCSSAESLGMRLYPWKIKPILRHLNSASSSSVSLLVSNPSRI